jgi:predicted DNA binding CopG/RHH family protein
MKKSLKIPKFKNPDQEFVFWSQLDLAKHFQRQNFVPVTFPNLRPTTKSISLRVPEYILSQVKEQANAIDVPYQALIKKYIAEGIKRDSAA